MVNLDNISLMDAANAFFEGGGSLFVLNHVRVLLKQRQVRGVSLLSIGFFTLWGVFNIFYYRHLGQSFSWYAGIAVLIANLIYVSLAIYFKRQESQNSLQVNS
jgi:uncharacterized membrane protein YfcA